MNETCDVQMKYPEAACEVATTLNDRLLNRKRKSEQELKEINEALDALNANPEVARVLTLVGKVIGRIG